MKKEEENPKPIVFKRLKYDGPVDVSALKYYSLA